MTILREVYVVNRIHSSITAPQLFKTADGRVEIEIPLRPRLRTVSFRVPEDIILSIDKTVVIKQIRCGERITRTALIERVIEALGEIFEAMKYNVDKVAISAENKSEKLTIVIRLSSSDVP